MPDPGTVHVSAALTNVSVAYKQPAFVADRVFLDLPVDKQADKYFIIDNERESFRDVEDLRAPAAPAKLVDFKVSNDPYCIEDHALRAYVPAETEGNADAPVMNVASATSRVRELTRRSLLHREILLKTLLFNTTTFSGYTSATALAWDQSSSYGDPIAHIDAAKAAIATEIGVPGNVVLLGQAVFNALRRNPYITDQFKYTSAESITAEMLARLFNVDEVLVGRAVYNSAAKGAAKSMAYVWPTEYCLTFYRPPSPGLEEPALGYRFVWKAMGPGGVRVERWQAGDGRLATGVAVHRFYDQKLVGACAGYLYSNCMGAS